MDRTERRLVVIAPTAPPNICGVSDYAILTAQQLKTQYRSVDMGVNRLPGDVSASVQIRVSRWQDLLANLGEGPTDVLLHYTPTSYAWTGFPIKLVMALRHFKKANPENRIFIFFHELWMDGFDMRMHHIIRNRLASWSGLQLARLADGLTTLTLGQHRTLKERLGQEAVIRLGLVGANILPEVKDNGLNSVRQSGRWVVFGLAHTRLWTLQAHLPMLQVLFRQGYLKQIYAIGPTDNTYGAQEAAFAEANFGPGSLVQLGALQSGEVSRFLLEVEAALVKQDADSLPKSGSFAAMAAHAVPVVCEVPGTLSNPPSTAFFSPAEMTANPALLTSDEGVRRRRQLHSWFWSTRSWEAIGNDLALWMA